MAYRPKDREEFVKRIQDAAPAVAPEESERVARLIMRHATTHDRLQEEYCNEEMSDRRAAAHERKEAQIERRITELCGLVGCTPIFDGDPRGYTVKVRLPSEKSNNWGGEGWGVPVSR